MAPKKEDPTAGMTFCPRCGKQAYIRPNKKIECEECGIVG